ncbi:MAG TPA: SH3 domain-containing protein [Clostridia bacterium]
MLKRCICLCIVILSVIGLFSNASAYEAASIKTMANTKLEMFNPDYWIDKTPDKDKVIMSTEEIKAYNKEVIKKLPTVAYDLASFPEKLSKEKLTKYLNEEFPKDPCYINDKEVSKEYWEKLKEQLNLSAVKDENEIKYGFTVRRTNLKIFPTPDIVSDSPDDNAFDQFQNTAVLSNEPVLILHKSLDEKWLYIVMHNCPGWALASDIAISPDKAKWLSNQNIESGKFLVVTGNKIKLDANFESPELSELEFSMGTILPLADKSEIPAFVDGRAPYDCYVVKLPVRGGIGELLYKLALVPISKDVSVGYMKYTRANVIRQLFKMHGDRYGWGGMLNARDCSSLVLEVFRSFGFRLPRNTESQVNAPGKTLSLKGLGQKGKKALLDGLIPGSALYFPGHTMIYIGKDNGHYYVMSALGMYAEATEDSKKFNVIRTRTVVINDLDVDRASGKSWLDDLTAAKLFEKSKFNDLDDLEGKEIIENMADRFLIGGKGSGKFEPKAKITRAEVSKILARGLKLEEDKEYSKKTFKDAGDNWYTGFAGVLSKEGLIPVSSNGLFSPGKEVDIKYLKSIARLILQKNGVDTSSSDGSKMLSKILTVDKIQGELNKEDSLTRYETTIIINNLFDSLEELKKAKTSKK